MRPDAKWLIAPLLALWPIAAAADDEAAKLISECSSPDVTQASLDSCLERVRVLEETQPSSGLQALEASLERRESAAPSRTQTASSGAPPARRVESAPAIAPEVMPPEQPVSESEHPADQRSRSGAAVEDEPPVSDAPGDSSGTYRDRDEDTSEPPQS